MTALLVGGLGRLEPAYRDVASSLGYELVYCENQRGRLPQANRLAYALVLVVVSEVSHSLRDQADKLAKLCGAPVSYLRTGSVSAVRKALTERQGVA